MQSSSVELITPGAAQIGSRVFYFCEDKIIHALDFASLVNDLRSS
jgi:hypothetical protein